MINENKTVAELLEGVEADGYGFQSLCEGVWISSAETGVAPSAYADTRSIRPFYYSDVIERVFGQVLAELDDEVLALKIALTEYKRAVANIQHTNEGLNEHIAALNALLVQKDIENANLSRAIAELTETKADFYRSGVADGRAQKDAERTSFSIKYETDPNIRTVLHTSDGVFHIDADGRRERLTEAKKESGE